MKERQESKRVISEAFEHLQEAIDSPIFEPTINLLLILCVHCLHSVGKGRDSAKGDSFVNSILRVEGRVEKAANVAQRWAKVGDHRENERNADNGYSKHKDRLKRCNRSSLTRNLP